MGSAALEPLARQNWSRLNAPSGSERLDALQTDLRFIRAGIACQDSSGSPNTWVGTPRARRCAAIDRPYGPAPMTAVVFEGSLAVIVCAASTVGRNRARPTWALPTRSCRPACATGTCAHSGMGYAHFSIQGSSASLGLCANHPRGRIGWPAETLDDSPPSPPCHAS